MIGSKFHPVRENLRPWDEVLAEQAETEKYRVADRRHLGLGLHRLHVLNCYPFTRDVIYGKARPTAVQPKSFDDTYQIDPDEPKKPEVGIHRCSKI
jgi:hypothetical protein